jgi:nucleotide-binding universal stress UspA family protein
VTVVVGYDTSDASRRALARAAEEVARTGEPLVVLAVFELPLDPRDPRNFGTPATEPAPTGPLPEPPQISAALAQAREQLERAGVEADYAWAPGEPASLIVDVAREREARLIVVGHHHHGLLSRMLGADVAAEVRSQADCEVMVVD